MIHRLLSHRLGRTLIGALGGAAVMLVFSFLMSRYSTTCTFICNPSIAGSLGALTGAIALFGQR